MLISIILKIDFLSTYLDNFFTSLHASPVYAACNIFEMLLVDFVLVLFHNV